MDVLNRLLPSRHGSGPGSGFKRLKHQNSSSQFESALLESDNLVTANGGLVLSEPTDENDQFVGLIPATDSAKVGLALKCNKSQLGGGGGNNGKGKGQPEQKGEREQARGNDAKQANLLENGCASSNGNNTEASSKSRRGLMSGLGAFLPTGGDKKTKIKQQKGKLGTKLDGRLNPSASEPHLNFAAQQDANSNYRGTAEMHGMNGGAHFEEDDESWCHFVDTEHDDRHQLHKKEKEEKGQEKKNKKEKEKNRNSKSEQNGNKTSAPGGAFQKVRAKFRGKNMATSTNGKNNNINDIGICTRHPHSCSFSSSSFSVSRSSSSFAISSAAPAIPPSHSPSSSPPCSSSITSSRSSISGGNNETVKNNNNHSKQENGKIQNGTKGGGLVKQLRKPAKIMDIVSRKNKDKQQQQQKEKRSKTAKMTKMNGGEGKEAEEEEKDERNKNRRNSNNNGMMGGGGGGNSRKPVDAQHLLLFEEGLAMD